jgi:hypothetical protein
LGSPDIYLCKATLCQCHSKCIESQFARTGRETPSTAAICTKSQRNGRQDQKRQKSWR